MKASSINRRDTATNFWANAAKEIVAATGVLDKGAVLDKGVLDVVEGVDTTNGADTMASILYTEASKDVEVFKAFGWKLRNEYNQHKQYGTARAGGVNSG